MSKQTDEIFHALNNMAITFDELGFEPTTANDKNYEHFNEWFSFEIYKIESNTNEQENQIKQLKQQLAEKDKLIEFGREEIKKRNKRIDEIVERDMKICEEKNKEIEKWHKLYKDRDNQFQSVRQRYHLLNRLQASYDKKDKLHLSEMQCLELIEINEKLQKNQTQLAIQELEKVKDWLNEPFDEDGCFKIGGDLIDFIDQQINELKGESNEN